MSEAKLISPLLDNFEMGGPISDHHGVRCCPAIEKETEDKYIVKIISSPATQTQLDALLLSGAYPNKEAAANYFKMLADAVVEEAEILENLAHLEGFVAYDKWQIEPMDGDETGYDVYLLSTYRNTLAQRFRKQSITHLGAINLGLDMCAALAVARRLGYIYVNLKPDNIYITGDNEYKIGDVGFIKLDSLKYASLPDRYRSQYTAPEIADAFSALNTTIDVYAAGLILYQAYNDGALPTHNEENPDEAFPAPAYADYEMAEIILKACAPSADQRWQDPVEMGQALISYMQRNGANDTPIAPVPVQETAVDEETEEEVGIYVQEEIEETLSDENIITEEQPKEVTEIEVTEEDIYSEDDQGNLTLLTDDTVDESAPDEIDSDVEYEEVTEEVSDMLVQVDELIAHEAPAPVIQPEPIDVPIPEPLPIEEKPAEELSSDEDEPVEEDEDFDEPVEDEEDDYAEESESTSKPRRHWLRNTILFVIALALVTAGFFFYKNYYLQSIESIVLTDNEAGTITVLVISDIDESKLTVVCCDTYGNQLPAPVVDGKATFNHLAPNSAYTIKVLIDGFHRLTGDTSTAFTTPTQTDIVQFSAISGPEDGSAILNFTIDGPDTNLWKILYWSENEARKEVSFSGHTTTITGLTIGTVYTFALEAENGMVIIGNTETQHTASKIVKAANLSITGCIDNTLTATWTAPEDITVEGWTVHCYNDSGYDKIVTVEGTEVSFEEIDTTAAYTLEVTAYGMSVSERVSIAANSITVTDFSVTASGSNLTISWAYNGTVPEGGWVLLYTVDGSPAQELTCKPENTATLTNAVPGATYKFTLKAAEEISVLGGTATYTTKKAEDFSGFNVKAKNMTFKMCKTPSSKKWDRHDLKKSDYTTTFSVDEKASFLVKLNKSYKKSSTKVTTLYVIRDAEGNIVSTATQSAKWKSMWSSSYCELDIPAIPQIPGDYTVSIYFNGQHANTQAFTVTE